METRILEVISPIAQIFPGYNPNAADINESLDHGVAGCAVRAYAAGLMIRQAYPNTSLYRVSFGFAPEHGRDYEGDHGPGVFMGHAVARLWIPERPGYIVESYNNASLEITKPGQEHDDYEWDQLTPGYRTYLERAGLGEVEVAEFDIMNCLLKRVAAFSQ